MARKWAQVPPVQTRTGQIKGPCDSLDGTKSRGDRPNENRVIAGGLSVGLDDYDFFGAALACTERPMGPSLPDYLRAHGATMWRVRQGNLPLAPHNALFHLWEQHPRALSSAMTAT